MSEGHRHGATRSHAQPQRGEHGEDCEYRREASLTVASTVAPSQQEGHHAPRMPGFYKRLQLIAAHSCGISATQSCASTLQGGFMALVGLKRAAELTGKNQSTIHRAMKTNRIAFTVAIAVSA